MNNGPVFIEERPEFWAGELSVTIKCKPSERREAEMLKSEIELLLEKVRPK